MKNIKSIKSMLLIILALSLTILSTSCSTTTNKEKTPSSSSSTSTPTILTKNPQEFLRELSKIGWKTERLELIKTAESDLDSLAPMFTSFDITKYYDGSLLPLHFKTKETAKEYLKSTIRSTQTCCFTIKKIDTHECIGQLGYVINSNDALDPFYWLGETYQNFGYASEASLELTKYILENTNIETLEIDIRPENTSSLNLATKIIDFAKSSHSDWKSFKYPDESTTFKVQLTPNSNKVTFYKLDKETSNFSSPLSMDKANIADEYLVDGKIFEASKKCLVLAKKPTKESIKSHGWIEDAA